VVRINKRKGIREKEGRRRYIREIGLGKSK
jgi:hypothetical protein